MLSGWLIKHQFLICETAVRFRSQKNYKKRCIMVLENTGEQWEHWDHFFWDSR